MSRPAFYPCGCSNLKVDAGLCDVYKSHVDPNCEWCNGDGECCRNCLGPVDCKCREEVKDVGVCLCRREIVDAEIDRRVAKLFGGEL